MASPLKRNQIQLVFALATVALMLAIGCSSGTPSGSEEPGEHTSGRTASVDTAKKEDSPTDQSDVDSPPSEAPRAPDVETPDTEARAMALYRQAQALMEEGKRQEGFEVAQQAMQQFIAEGNELAWMLLESEIVDGNRIDVHFNMGPDEREMPEMGIVRPLSFRIWSTDDDPVLTEVIDFEISRFGGESLTAAIGSTHSRGHINYGILDIDASYEEIKQAVIEVVGRD